MLAARWYEPVTVAMAEFGIDTPARQAMFLAQIGHESGGFTALSENLNYSADGLANTWPGRYGAKDGTGTYIKVLNDRGVKRIKPNALANSLHRRPEAIANNCYQYRMGNGSEAGGDGWRYRGRGLKQLTGRENYGRASTALGVDLVANPDLLATNDVLAARSAAWFWSSHNLNACADRGDCTAATKIINGGDAGLKEREASWKVAQRALGVT